MLEGGLGCDPGNYESSGPYRTCQRGLYCPGSGDRGGKDRCIYGGNIMDAETCLKKLQYVGVLAFATVDAQEIPR